MVLGTATHTLDASGEVVGHAGTCPRSPSTRSGRPPAGLTGRDRADSPDGLGGEGRRPTAAQAGPPGAGGRARPCRPVTVHRFEVGAGPEPGTFAHRGRRARRGPTSGCWRPTWDRARRGGAPPATCGAPRWGRSPRPRPGRSTTLRRWATWLATPVEALRRPRGAWWWSDEVARSTSATGLPLGPGAARGRRAGPLGAASIDRRSAAGRLRGRPTTDRIRPAVVSSTGLSTAPGSTRHGLTSERWRSCGPTRCDPPARGDGGDHRRLRRRPPRPPPPPRRAGRSRRRAGGCETAVVTFDRHPATVVRPESAPAAPHRPRPEARAAGRLRGRPHRWWSPSTGPGPTRRPRTSSTRCWSAPSAARLVVVGQDFHFGHGRKGNVALLSELGDGRGFDVEASPWPTGERRGPRLLHPDPRAGRRGRRGGRGGAPRAAPPGAGHGGPRRRPGRRRARLPDGQRRPARRDRPARPRHLRRPATRGPDGSVHPAAISVGPPADLLRPTTRRRPWWRPTCSTSTGTSTASRPGSPSSARLRPEQRFDRCEALVAQMHATWTRPGGLLAAADPRRSSP